MKRITFVASYSLQQHPAIRNRLAAYINEGLALGYSVRLISPDSDIPELAKHPGLTHVPIPAGKGYGSNFFKRAIAESITAWRALRTAKHYAKEEHVVITIPSMFLLFLSPLLGRKKYHLDARDLSWEYLSDSSFLLRKIKLCFRWLAKITIKRFGFVITTNETDHQFVKQALNVPDNRALLIHNGVSRKQFEILSLNYPCTSPVLTASKEHSPPITVSYIGNVGLAQNLTTLIQAAHQLPHIQFNIVGTGSDFNRIRNHANDLHLANIKLWGHVDWEQIPNIYQASDILYAQLTPEYDRAMPSKLYEYLSTGRFIIYGGGAQAKTLLSRFEHFAVIPPNDVNALVKAISDFEEHRLPSSKLNSHLIEAEFIREKNVRQFYNNLQQSRP